MCVEKALAEPGSIIMYAGPSITQVYGITKPIHRAIFETCPDELKPRHEAKFNLYEFPNGSLMWMLAADMNKSDSSRGKSCHFGVFDEEGFAKDPEPLIKSVMTPAIMHSDGMLLHISTPAETPSHPFCQRMRAMEGQPNFMQYTLYDNPLLSKSFIEECEKEMGGAHTTAFRREYLCQIVTEEMKAVLPEMSGEIPSSLPDAPMVGTPVVALSVDFSGLTVAVVCRKGTKSFEILDERVMRGANAGMLRDCLEGLFNKHKFPENARYVFATLDENARIILASNNGYPIAEPHGFDEDSSRGVLRTIISQGTLVISADAPVTRRHLTDAIWNDARTKYELSGDSGRFDAVHAVLVGFHASQSYRPPQELGFSWPLQHSTQSRASVSSRRKYR